MSKTGTVSLSGLAGGDFSSFFVTFEVLYLHRSLLILSAFNAVIVVLSTSAVQQFRLISLLVELLSTYSLV